MQFTSLEPLDADPDDAWDVVSQHRRRFLVKIDQPLLLISQIQRSGGSLLSQLLDGHSQLHVHPSELQFSPKKWAWPQLDLAAEPGAIFDGLAESKPPLHAAGGYRKLSAAGRQVTPDEVVLPFIFLPRLQKDLFVRIVRRESRREVLDAYATSYFNAWLDYQGLYRQGARYWAAFRGGFFGRPGAFDAYLADYPDGQAVSTVRDPVSWYASARRHRAVWADPAQAAAAWVEANQIILADVRRYPASATLVRYEDVVGRAEASMSTLAARLGLAFEPSMLRPTFNGMDIASNSSFGAKHGLDASALDRSGDLQDEDIRIVRRLAQDLHDEMCAAALKP